MKRAVITGATGAVGTALVKELASNGIEVLVLCRKGSKRNGQIPEYELVTKKYCALNELAAVQNDTGKNYDIFYHFAWEGTTGAARNDMYLQNQNVRYALDAVAAAKRFGCHTFIGAGSQAEYGRVEGLLKPDTPHISRDGVWHWKTVRRPDDTRVCTSTWYETYLDTHSEHLWSKRWRTEYGDVHH